MAAGGSRKTGGVTTYGFLPEDFVIGFPIEQKLPGTRTLRLSTGHGIQWSMDVDQYGGHDRDGFPVVEASYTLGAPQTFKGGKTYTKTFNRAVFGPRLGRDHGLFRDGNEIYGSLPVFADSAGHAGYSEITSAKTTLYRNNKKVGSNSDPLTGDSFTVPAGDAAYKLTASVTRSAKIANASTRIDATWTFRSKKSSRTTQLPASSARFKATTGTDNRVKAGKKTTFPVTVEGAAAGKNLKSLSVWVSYDNGKTWKKVTVKKGRITVKNPAKGKGVSYRAKIVDKKGNTSTISIYNAYYGK
jgi:hypothetical protein